MLGVRVASFEIMLSLDCRVWMFNLGSTPSRSSTDRFREGRTRATGVVNPMGLMFAPDPATQIPVAMEVDYVRVYSGGN